MKPNRHLLPDSASVHSDRGPMPLFLRFENLPPGSGGSNSPKKHILLVDDDPSVRDSLNNVLWEEGYAVTTAENGQQALDFVNKLKIDLVLLDLNMPVMNGWETFERLTRNNPTIPVIITTARSNQLFTAVSSGAGALLEKPMDISILLRTIEKLLAETFEQRLARFVGENSEFSYTPAPDTPFPGERT